MYHASARRSFCFGDEPLSFLDQHVSCGTPHLDALQFRDGLPGGLHVSKAEHTGQPRRFSSAIRGSLIFRAA